MTKALYPSADLAAKYGFAKQYGFVGGDAGCYVGGEEGRVRVYLDEDHKRTFRVLVLEGPQWNVRRLTQRFRTFEGALIAASKELAQ